MVHHLQESVAEEVRQLVYQPQESVSPGDLEEQHLVKEEKEQYHFSVERRNQATGVNCHRR
jgi:hypothetical protein